MNMINVYRSLKFILSFYIRWMSSHVSGCISGREVHFVDPLLHAFEMLGADAASSSGQLFRAVSLAFLALRT